MQLDLGDIVLAGPDGSDRSSSLLLDPGFTALSSNYTDRFRYAPVHHRLFDQADTWPRRKEGE
jgi:hypothetical protein